MSNRSDMSDLSDLSDAPPKKNNTLSKKITNY